MRLNNTRISKDYRVAGTQLFDHMDGVSPQTIVEVTLVEDIIGPTLLVGPLFPGKDSSM